jgi:putative serine protease PepD
VLARQYDLPAEWGAFVQSVSADSPAAVAGLAEGDIITAIDGVPLNETTNFVNTLWTHAAGDTISLSVLRDNATLTVAATLGERPRS